MPSPLAHAAMGYAVARAGSRAASRGFPPVPLRTLLPVAIFVSLLPDMDAVAGILLGDMGRYHNHFMGSPFFGLLAALAVAATIRLVTGTRFGLWFGVSLACYQLHLLMDFLTWGRGTMLLWPLSTERFPPPVRLFYGLHWSEGPVSHHHLHTFWTELLFALALAGLVELSLRARRRKV